MLLISGLPVGKIQGGDLFVKGVANRQNTLYIMSWIKCIPHCSDKLSSPP